MDHNVFLAIKIELDKNLKAIYYDIKKSLARQRVKFYPPQELMLIIRYLGSVPGEFLSEINRQIASLINRSPRFDVIITGIEIYPYNIMPRVLWFRVQQDEPLMTLAANIEQIVRDLTSHEEDFAFYPHITFARIRQLKNLSAIDKVRQYQDIEPTVFEVKQIILYEKISGSDGNVSKYKVRNRFELDTTP